MRGCAALRPAPLVANAFAGTVRLIRKGGRATFRRLVRSAAAGAAIVSFASAGSAQVIAASPTEPVHVAYPRGAQVVSVDVNVTLFLTVDASGNVQSAEVAAVVPSDAPTSFAETAVDSVRGVRFTPSTRDGRPVRSRVRYVVLFHAAALTPPAPSPAAGTPPTSTNEADEDYSKEVQVLGVRRSSSRGLGDVRIKRELLDASPRTQAGELLSAAPGFFVDHEDSEGFANDVVLRGFDLEHGAGIEMKVGSVPFNIPLHVQGQGYADPSFIIPEVVRSVRVQSGPYDPKQGDAAIAGSAYFDLGVRERGYRLQFTHGSFDQTRLVAIAAPKGEDEETFAAVALRKSDGFGQHRASRSASAMAQLAIHLGPRDDVHLLATAHGARAELAGVVRSDDVDAGRIGFDDTYPRLIDGSGVQSSRFIFGVDYDHVADNGAHLEVAPWLMLSDFVARQNLTGNLETSRENPALFGLGDMFESANRETALGAVARFRAASWRPTQALEVVLEPGVSWRTGFEEQSKTLLVPGTLAPWDHRLNQHLRTIDAAAFLDVDTRLGNAVRIAGGLRADWLGVAIDDRIGPAPAQPTDSTREASGGVLSPRITAELLANPAVVPVVSWGEGFRSLDASSLITSSGHPYSKVRSFEAGLRMQALQGRFTSTVTGFTTYVGNELVFEASSGGLTTERASTRRGFVASLISNPAPWLLISTALSLTRATFDTSSAVLANYVPNVPPVLFRTDATLHAPLGRLGNRAVQGRVGIGYTFVGARHLTDTITGTANHVVNTSAAVRWGIVELTLDAYNVLGRRYADDAEVYVSNWSARGGQPPASTATHLTPAPPRTVLGTIAVLF